MLTKFETKSSRVKGLSFHPKRPWILAGLHSGSIELWDYRLSRLIVKVDEHKGPVRGVDFHTTQSLFVSGGDDYKIKVWNYETHKCLFTHLGHLDYIRTVQFHREKPWIVSASDDHTIRIWNWQSRTCISVLTGHNHYVMCASFHPKEDLLLSASLDQTVRVWDIASKTVNYILEGHDRGVNWASFHPTLPLIVSCSDDSQVKLWRINETKAREVKTLQGHTDNVSCVLFHAKQNLIVSNSEDTTIRVWDATMGIELQTIRRDRDRFWTMAIHPEINLLAAGHDNGLIVFKLGRERPAFAVSGDSLYYAKEGCLRCYEFSSQRDSELIPIRRPRLNQSPRTLSYSPRDNAVLICSDVDGGSYDLYSIPKDTRRGTGGGSAVFIARNRFAVLDKNTNQVVIKNLENVMIKKISLPIPTDAIFYAGTGNLLCRSESKVVVYDLQQKLVLGELQTPLVKYVVWSNDMENVALLSKHTIIIASKKLVQQGTLHEKVGVKSGAWDENGVFIYSTLNHMKYCLPNGDNGIIQTMNVPIYITKVTGHTIFCLDRDGENRAISIDASEYLFKISLMRKRYDHVMSMIKNSQLCGQAMIAYLQQKGYSEAALHLVEDERIRFNLAIESGNINIAVESATKINEKDHWYRLGLEAIRQGSYSIVEFAYQQTVEFERLSFLYLITGNLDKLSKLKKNNVMDEFHNALYLGDVKERVKILENAGHLPLAYITALVHGLNDISERLGTELGDKKPSLPKGKTPSLLMPQSPVMCGGDWPLLLERVAVDKEEEEEEEDEDVEKRDIEETDGVCGWGDIDLDLPPVSNSQV